MRWGILLSILLFIAAPAAFAAESASVLKVLPQFLDLKGRHTLSPSLYERDAYQARLQKHPEQRGGLRFAVQWRSKSPPTGPLKLKFETRSTVGDQPPHSSVFEQPLAWANARSHWSELNIRAEAYEKLGEVSAWRATLWDGETQIAESKSFLW